ncbi:MAG: hypothetical protein A3E01_08370 [Gammaproteobacteria bacterium RIFCSPHIGHO2_12_FULL_63_22]|nr:MAG: hypothetical protein A3E01_08370 [Gammaproteobacteria bacterium RIFCSPHIGHO2_12_FULL_63_22]
MDQTSTADEAVLNGIMGHALTSWELGDGGMHFALDDGRQIIFARSFVIAVIVPKAAVVH